MPLLRRLFKFPPCLLPLIMVSFLLPVVCGCNTATAVQPVEHAASTAGSSATAERILFTGISQNENEIVSPVELAIVVASILLFAATTIRDP